MRMNRETGQRVDTLGNLALTELFGAMVKGLVVKILTEARNRAAKLRARIIKADTLVDTLQAVSPDFGRFVGNFPIALRLFESLGADSNEFGRINRDLAVVLATTSVKRGGQ